jgi:hypothetical protein
MDGVPATHNEVLGGGVSVVQTAVRTGLVMPQLDTFQH